MSSVPVCTKAMRHHLAVLCMAHGVICSFERQGHLCGEPLLELRALCLGGNVKLVILACDNLTCKSQKRA